VFPALSDSLRSVPPQSLALALAVAMLLLVALAVWSGRLVRRRLQAERAGAEARGQLQTITSTMREGVIAYDLRFQLVFANPAFERLTGKRALYDLLDRGSAFIVDAAPIARLLGPAGVDFGGDYLYRTLRRYYA